MRVPSCTPFSAHGVWLGFPHHQLQEWTQTSANQCISSPRTLIGSGLGLWPNSALGVRPRAFVWSGGLGAMKELVSSGGQVATMREEAVENKTHAEENRAERLERTGPESVFCFWIYLSFKSSSWTFWESMNMFHFLKSLCIYYANYASLLKMYPDRTSCGAGLLQVYSLLEQKLSS